MKHQIYISLMLMLFSNCAVQKVPLDTTLLSYEKVINLPEKAKDDAYVLSNTWMVETFTSAESVVEFSDKEAGTIIGKYIFNYGKSFIKSVIQIDTRSDKCRISFKNPTIKNIGGDIDYRRPKTNKSLKIINNEWQKLANDFKLYLLKNEQWN